VLIVDTDVVRVERQLRAGELTCPSCGAVLAPWGHGRPREIRGDLGARLFVRPRRSRCMGCRITHVLLPEMLWPRRADAAEVIDESHLLDHHELDAIRMLTNYDMDSTTPFRCS
jgi:hypothetical protein